MRTGNNADGKGDEEGEEDDEQIPLSFPFFGSVATLCRIQVTDWGCDQPPAGEVHTREVMLEMVGNGVVEGCCYICRVNTINKR